MTTNKKHKTINAVEKEFKKLSTSFVGDGGWCCRTDNKEGLAIWPESYGDLWSFILRVYSEAEAKGFAEGYTGALKDCVEMNDCDFCQTELDDQ